MFGNELFVFLKALVLNENSPGYGAVFEITDCDCF